MIRAIVWALVILGSLLVLQTTILSYLVVFGVKPNILIIVLAILSIQNGSFASQIIGFIFGLVVDTVTASPLGFHAFLFSLSGYCFGLGSGKVYFDPIVMPVLLGLLVTVFMIFAEFLINLLFHLGQPISVYFNIGTIFQLFLNMLLSPVVFWLMGWVKERFQNSRRGFGG